MVLQILWGAVSGSAFLTSLATTKSKLAGVPQDRHQVLPLGPPVGRFTLLPIGGGTGNRRLEQPDDKPQVSWLYSYISAGVVGMYLLVHILFFGNLVKDNLSLQICIAFHWCPGHITAEHHWLLLTCIPILPCSAFLPIQLFGTEASSLTDLLWLYQDVLS